MDPVYRIIILRGGSPQRRGLMLCRNLGGARLLLIEELFIAGFWKNLGAKITLFPSFFKIFFIDLNRTRYDPRKVSWQIFFPYHEFFRSAPHKLTGPVFSKKKVNRTLS
jgi:hypothetical protein